MKVSDNEKNTHVGWFFWEVQGSSFKVDLKNSISSFFKKFILKKLGQDFKFFEKNILADFQSASSYTFHTN